MDMPRRETWPFRRGFLTAKRQVRRFAGRDAADYRVAAFSLPVLHGGGTGLWDELLPLLGVVAVVGVLFVLTWRSGRKKQIARRARRGRK